MDNFYMLTGAGETVHPNSIFKCQDGRTWYVRTSYKHLGKRYVTCIEVPEDLATVELMEASDE